MTLVVKSVVAWMMKPLIFLGALEIPFAATKIPDANLVLNLIMLIVLLFGAPRFFKSKTAENMLGEKDRIILTHQQTIDVQDRKIQDIEARCNEFVERAAKYQQISAGYQARYEEQQRYTAKPALELLQQTLITQHAEMMSALGTLQEVVGERRQSALVDSPRPPK